MKNLLKLGFGCLVAALLATSCEKSAESPKNKLKIPQVANESGGGRGTGGGDAEPITGSMNTTDTTSTRR